MCSDGDAKMQLFVRTLAQISHWSWNAVRVLSSWMNVEKYLASPAGSYYLISMVDFLCEIIVCPHENQSIPWLSPCVSIAFRNASLPLYS